MAITDISDEESKLIERHRREKSLNDAQYKIGLLFVQLTAEWADYSISTGEGLTFSTFLDKFDAAGRAYKICPQYILKSKYLYDGVKTAIDTCDVFSSRVVKSMEF